MSIEQRVRAKYGVIDKNFEIQSIFKKLKFNNLKYKTADLPDRPTKTNPLPALTAGVLNQGLNNYVPETNATIFQNVISVSANGANTGVMFYQTQKFTVLQDAYVIDLIDKPENINIEYLYLVGALQKSIRFNFDWTNKAGWERIKTELVTLPTHINGEIAFDYMAEYIKELQAERIKQLEAYLLATGLNAYTLTEDEKKLISEFRTGTVRWGTFKIVDIFNVKNTKNILSRDVVKNSGKIPYLTAGEANNSIGTYVSYDLNQIEEGNSIFIGGKTFVVTYQKLNYFSNDSHNLALYYKEEDKRTKANQLFMVTSIYKSLSHLYSWGDSISNRKIQKDFIKLPIKSDDTPDFDKINSYILAIEKLVIKGVIEWKDTLMV